MSLEERKALTDERKDQLIAEEIDLRDIFKVLKKRRKIIVIITLIAILSSGLISIFVLDPVYEAKSKLLVTMASDNQRSVSSEDNLESVISSVSRLPQMTINSYVEQLKSEALMQRVIKEMDIEEHDVTPRAMSSIVSVNAIPDSNILEVKAQHTNAQLSVDVLNTLNKEYLDQISEKNQEQMSRSMTFFNEQKGQRDEQLEEAMTRLKEFNSQPRGVEFLEKEFSIMTDDLNQYLSQLDMLGVEIKELQAGVSRLAGELQNVPQTLTVNKQEPETGQLMLSEELNPVYSSLTDRLNEKEAQLAEKMARREAILAVTQRLKSDLSSLQAELSDKRIRQEQLQREADMLRETSNLLAQKATQTQIAKSIDLGSTSVVVVSPAINAYKVKPNIKLNLAVAMVLGLMIAVGLAFLLEFMDNTIKNSDDVEKHLDLPVVGLIPDITREK